MGLSFQLTKQGQKEERLKKILKILKTGMRD